MHAIYKNNFSLSFLTKLLFCLFVFLFYLWIAGSNGVPLIVDVGSEHHEQIRSPNLFPDISPHHYGFYNLLADAFEKGRLDLLIDPPQDLIALPNPRDPKLSEKTRILDLSLYNNRFYLYFGPVPALCLFLPFRCLGIGKISEPLAVAIFSYGLFLCMFYILSISVKRYIPKVNRFLLTLSVFSIAFSTCIPYVLRHPVVYEVAIVSGAFFAMLGLALLVKAWTGSCFNNFWLFASGTALGLSIGCRPNYVFSIIFLFVIIFLANTKNLNFYFFTKNCFAILTPIFTSIICLVTYNKIRFGSFNNFGMHYLLGPTQWDYVNCMYRFSNIPPGFFLNVLCPYIINNIFPFIHLRPFYPFLLPPGFSFEEPIGGFLLTSPITSLILLIPFILLKQYLYKINIFAYFLLLFGFLIFFLQIWIVFGTTMRYQVDFLPSILLGSIIGSLHFESKINVSLKKSIITTGIAVLLCIGIVTHLAFGMTGIFDTFRRGEPRQYFALENFFRPVSALLTPVFGSDQTKILDITIPNGSTRFEDGAEGPWLGEEGFYVRFTAAQTIPMQFSADVVVRPDLPYGVKLEFENPAGSSKSSVVKGISRQTFQFTLQPGSNRITIFATPNSPLLKGQDNLRLAVLKNIQIAPVGRN